MGAGETAEGHRIEPLARETGIPHAVEIFHSGAVERHWEKTGKLHRWDGAVAALKTTKKPPMTPGRADLLVGDGITKARQDRFEPLDQLGCISLFFGVVVAGGKPLPGLHG